jgi:hypothetical protein
MNSKLNFDIDKDQMIALLLIKSIQIYVRIISLTFFRQTSLKYNIIYDFNDSTESYQIFRV